MVKMVGIVIVGVAVIAGVASRFIFKKSDNIVEEIAEKVIKDKTGYDVDLSPDTPEGDISLDMIMTPKNKKAKDAKNKCNKQ